MRYIFFLLLYSVSGFCSPPHTFPQAKKIAGALFASHQNTLYCQCQYDKTRVDLTSCGMQRAELIKRAHRVEWEHIMPAEQFGRHFRCWHEALCEKNGKPYKGRACCEKIEPEFRRIEAELYNLWPADGYINQLRSNYQFAILPHKQQTYGCSFYSDPKLKQAEPPDYAKGIVARANLFMANKYKVQLSKGQVQLFKSWDAQFPPTYWELEWAKQVAKIEGYDNPYILG